MGAIIKRTKLNAHLELDTFPQILERRRSVEEDKKYGNMAFSFINLKPMED